MEAGNFDTRWRPCATFCFYSKCNNAFAENLVFHFSKVHCYTGFAIISTKREEKNYLKNAVTSRMVLFMMGSH